MKLKINSLVELTIFQAFNSHVWLLATKPDSPDLEKVPIIKESSIKECCPKPF